MNVNQVSTTIPLPQDAYGDLKITNRELNAVTQQVNAASPVARMTQQDINHMKDLEYRFRDKSDESDKSYVSNSELVLPHAEAKAETLTLGLGSLVSKLLKEEFPLSNPNARRTLQQRQQFALYEKPKKSEAALLSTVIAGLTVFADERATAQAMALLEGALGQGPDAVVAAFRQVKDALWSPKIDQIVSQSATTLAVPKKEWTTHHFAVKHFMGALAGLDRADIYRLSMSAIPATEPHSAERNQARALWLMIREQVFFSVDDRSRVEGVKTFLADHASEGLTALQEAAEQLRRPQLDQMVRDAGAIFGNRSYAELSSVEKRFARMVTNLQSSGLAWADMVKDIMVPQYIREKDPQA